MSKVARVAKKAVTGRRDEVQTSIISTKNYFNTKILAQCASAAPPLGPLLGSYGLNISNFCKIFNEKTQNYKKGIPLPVTVRIKPDRSYELQLHTPSITYYLKQAAGIDVGKIYGEKKTGEITLKHIYEIAKIKHKDPYSKHQIQDLEEVVKHVVGLSFVVGLEIVKEINPVEYKKFLDQRRQFLDDMEKKLEEEKKLKYLRVKDS